LSSPKSRGVETCVNLPALAAASFALGVPWKKRVEAPRCGQSHRRGTCYVMYRSKYLLSYPPANLQTPDSATHSCATAEYDHIFAPFSPPLTFLCTPDLGNRRLPAPSSRRCAAHFRGPPKPGMVRAMERFSPRGYNPSLLHSLSMCASYLRGRIRRREPTPMVSIVLSNRSLLCERHPP
jgi:hypothetical protein